MNPRVSVGCTFKNAESILPETIESIIEQSIDDWEMVLIDDGSTDNSFQVVKAFADRDPRIKVIRTDGVGRSAALNLAVQNSVGEYWANIDADDPSHPQRLEIELKHLEEHPEFCMTCSPVEFVYDEDSVEFKSNYELSSVPFIDVTEGLCFHNPIPHSTVMLRRPLALSHPYDETRNTNVDYELWSRFLCSGNRISLIQLPLGSKRLHKNQSFENRNRIRYVWNSIKVQYRCVRGSRFAIKKYAALLVQVIALPVPRWARLKIGVLIRKIKGV